MSKELGDKLAEIERLEGFIAGLKHARDWCKSSETYINDEIDEKEEELSYLISKL